MNTILLIITFIVLLVALVVLRHTLSNMAASFYRGGSRSSGNRGSRSRSSSSGRGNRSGSTRTPRATVTLDDPRDVAHNTLYSPATRSYTHYNTKNNMYVLPNTNKQIETILKTGTPKNIASLFEILLKRTTDTTGLMALLNTIPTDAKVYKLLSTSVTPTGIDRDADMKRGEYMGRHYHMHVKHLLNYEMKAPKYLDIGGKEGGITKEFAKLINASTIDAVEVDEYDDPEGKINYHILKTSGDGSDGSGSGDGGDGSGSSDESDSDYKLPYKNNQFDVITAFMVLHHVENLPSMLSEIKRILAPNGRFIILDHDCWDVYDAMLIDIEHLIYQVGSEGYDVKDTWYMRYFSRSQLRGLVAPLKFLSDNYVSGGKPEIAANRKFWAVYAAQ